MSVGNPFIRHPYVAIVMALVITLCGALAAALLPVAQYPDVTPPAINVSVTYPGADARTLLETVVEPIEDQINGVRDLLYLSSTSSDSGSAVITATFDIGSSGEQATQNVQDRVNWATPQLPEAVQKEGVIVREQSGNILLCISLYSPQNTYDSLFLANYATLHLIDQLKRISGVAEVQIFGGSDYAMRIWLDEEKLAGLGMPVESVLEALGSQNVQVSAGSVGSAPAAPTRRLRYDIRTRGRLTTPEDFGAIVLRTQPDGAQVRLSDVAQIEFGSENYSTVATIDNHPAVMIVVFQRSAANALDVADSCRAVLADASAGFPPDLAYGFQYDSTRFIRDSIRNVAGTLAAAVLLVALVVFIFLQDWRMALVPVLAIPVSIVGTFAVLKLLGFSINLVTLFALILAIGIVVDDAIIVIENVSRLMSKEKLDPVAAANRSMREITGAIVATTLVLLAMFVPITFLPGITGELYRQFGVTLTVAVLLSALNALTLSPALAALLLRPHRESEFFFFKWFNAGFDRVSGGYYSVLRPLVRGALPMLAVYLAFAGLAAWWYSTRPAGFIPPEDQGVFFTNLQLPGGAALPRTEAATRRAVALLRKQPGVSDVLAAPGFNILNMTPASNNAFGIVVLEDWQTRLKQKLPIDRIMLDGEFALAAQEPEMFAMLFEPPPLPGVGTAGGFSFVLENETGTDPARLAEALDKLLMAAMVRPELRNVFTTFSAANPYLYLQIDRDKALRMGVSLDAVDRTLENLLGFNFVNDFNRFGRVYKVELQSLDRDRDLKRRIEQMYVPNNRGEMVPFSSFSTVKTRVAPEFLNRYNLNLSATVQGSPAPGYSSGQAMAVMEKLADELLLPGMRYDWTGLSYQEALAGGQTWVIFTLAAVFIYLFLSGLYESWLLPLPVLLAVPAALAGALVFLSLSGVDNNIYTEIGTVLLFGMACKTAILIVDFAKQQRDAGNAPADAAVQAARLRFRAILMTAFAFIFGTLPLVFASGPGAGSQRSIGVVVVGGMIAGAVGAMLFIPAFFTLFQKLIDRFGRRVPLLLTALALLAGCYTPPPGGSLIDEQSYNPPPPAGDRQLVLRLTRLELGEAKRIALANNPTYRSTRYAIEAARMRYYQALGAYSPTLSAAFAVGAQLYDGGGSDDGSSSTSYTFTTVQASWMIFNGLAREFSLLASRHDLTQEELLEEDARQILLRAVSYAYFELISARAQAEIAEADIEFQSAQLHDAELKFRVGDLPPSEVLNFRGKLNQARISKVKAERQIRLGFHSLAVLMGYEAGTLSEELALDPPGAANEQVLLPVDAYLDRALSDRPDLNAYREQLKIMEYQLYQSYGSFSPTLSVFANYSYSSNSTQNSGNNPTGFGNFYQEGNSFNYGGLVEWQLFSGLTRYNRSRELRADLDMARISGADTWNRVVREVRDAHTTLQSARELRDLARTACAILREQRDLVAREYAVGEVDVVRLDSAQDQYIRSENELLSAEVSVRRAIVALDYASGIRLSK